MGNILKRYLANNNLHGTRYLVEDDRHWTERLFWFITCTLCWWGCIIMIKDSVEAYYTRPLAFTVESTYLDWETDFASITICLESKNTPHKTISMMAKEKYGISIAEPMRWNWMVSKEFKLPPASNNKFFSTLTSEQIINLYESSKVNCTDLLTICYWNFVDFNCCEEFIPFRTGAGHCYMFNSMQTPRNKRQTRNFTMSHEKGHVFFDIGLSDFSVAKMPNIKMYIHNKYGVPTFNTYSDKELSITPSGITLVYFDPYDTFNDPETKGVPPSRRHCRFPDETEDFGLFKWYSNDACIINLQMEFMLELCGCVSHIFPYEPSMPVCNYTRLSCLRKQYNLLKSPDYVRQRCPADCEGMLIDHSQEKEPISKRKTFRITQGIHIEPLHLPTSRYRRYVVFSQLDLAVAIGSTTSLFMGAGILSIVEILYWFLWRLNS